MTSADPMRNYAANANLYPLSSENVALHQGECVARSLDGINVLAFGRDVDTIRKELKARYQMTLRDAVLDTVD